MQLGEGGAATVYEAEVTTLDVSADFNEQQAVAVKKVCAYGVFVLQPGSQISCSLATLERCVQVVCSDAAQLRSAEKERDLMKMQLHPGIMPLLDSGTEQTAPPQSRQILYMLMPLYTGGSLWDVVHAQSQPLSNNQILSILEQVCFYERLCSLQHTHKPAEYRLLSQPSACNMLVVCNTCV